ncbi:MAG: hypothetical protein JST82_15425 [Bacteroidetes bacterium]|nr:hypothetical protein [Bacteroidota bacterium]
MKILTLFALLISFTASAQVDLSKDPNKPTIPKQKSNAQLLQESKPPAQPADTSLSGKFNNKNIAAPVGGNQYNENGRLNSQSTQYNMGNTKATNTINYDNSGKVQGSSTTIQFGKKKK